MLSNAIHVQKSHISFYSPWPSGDTPGEQVYLEAYDAWLRELSRLIEVYKRKASDPGRQGRDTDGRTARWDDAAGRMVISWA